MTAALALLLDAYRELNSRKLVAGSHGDFIHRGGKLGSISFDSTGMSCSFGATHIDSEFIRQEVPGLGRFISAFFSDFHRSIWLAWIASMRPDIDTTISLILWQAVD